MQALSAAEKAFGPDHPNVATSLNSLALLYDTQGQYERAEPHFMRALEIRERTLGPEHPTVATSLYNLAALYSTQGKYVQAEPLYKRSLAITEKILGKDHPDVASTLNDLATLNHKMGRYDLAEPLYERSLAIVEKARGPEHLDVAMRLNNLAELYRTQGQYVQAEAYFQRALAISEKALGRDHSDVATNLNNLAHLYANQGKYAQAELLFNRSLAISEKVLGPDHPTVATGLNNLAELYRTQGQYDLAEALYKRSLAITEKSLGLDHPDVADSLNNLAAMYRAQSQYAQAEQLLKRSLVVNEKALGPDHPHVSLNLNNLAELYSAQRQYAKAEPLYKRSLAIWEIALSPDHPHVAVNLNNLAELYRTQGQYAQAEPLLKRSLAISEKAFGTDHLDVARSLNNLALLYDNQGQYTQAEPLFKRSLDIRENILGLAHPDVAQSLNNLALLYGHQSQYEQALSMARRASDIYRQRIVSGGTSDTAIREAAQNRSGFLIHLSLLFRNQGKEPGEIIDDEAFQIVQLEQASGTASAIAKMAARFASGDDALAGLVKRKQDAGERRAKSEAQLVVASSKAPEKRRAADEQRLRDDSALAGKEINMIDAELTRRFPEYQELTRPTALSVGQIQALLRPDEAMLVYAFGGSQIGFLWVVRPDGAGFLGGQVDVKAMVANVTKVRSEMEFDSAGQASRVSVGLLHDLYQSLIAPAMPHLAGVRHIMVVPAGPLQSLPFSMLVASPAPAIKSAADYLRVNWLAKHYALSVLPAVSSIQAFRRFTKAGGAQEPFAGFGDPVIGGSNSTTRAKRAKMDVATVFRNLTVKKPTATGSATTEIADVDAIRNASRLPETADELRAMGKVLKASPNSIWLQENATETKIKHLDLSKYRTIAFATHGVMAGEVKGIGEPGLILTPPQQGSLEDDGYLSAGEIARLKLNTDWVVLSACNTAAADGTPGAEGFSGLAKAFFYAGARSLLVSHWPVASEATVSLTTGMLREYEANPGLSKAEAHRKAMLALMATRDHPEYAHPIFWAPFVVVGEGGTSTAGKASTADRSRK